VLSPQSILVTPAVKVIVTFEIIAPSEGLACQKAGKELTPINVSSSPENPENLFACSLITAKRTLLSPQITQGKHESCLELIGTDE
jgi:hypothetical protein